MLHPTRPARPASRRQGLRTLTSGAALLALLASCGPADGPAVSADVPGGQTDQAVAEPDAPETPDAPEERPDESGPSTPAGPSEPAPEDDVDASGPLQVTRLTSPIGTAQFEESGDDDVAAWLTAVPGITDVRIPSSQDGAEQGAFWLPPAAPDRPLLVVLHSWSSPYQQQLNIPYGRWAQENGWGMIVPDFRGVNERPEATASDLAVADVLDAVDYGLAEGGGDADLVFAVGFSGGGMMSLVMAGRAPERFAGVAAWVPIYDLGEWHARKVAEDPEGAYVGQIEASCGGPPLPGSPAAQECASRSPATVLDAAAEAGVAVYIGAGLSDNNVPASDAALSFNALAAEADRLDDAAVAALGSGTLPEGEVVDPEVDTFFGAEQPPVLLARESGPVTLVVFEGEHEMLYDPGLQWMAAGAPAGG